MIPLEYSDNWSYISKNLYVLVVIAKNSEKKP